MSKQDTAAMSLWPIIQHVAAMSLLLVVCSVAHAQQQPPAAAPAPPAAAPAPAAPQQQFQPSDDWKKLPRMTIERQFAGPLRDTVIQRLRDPADGTICYIYLPISAPHSVPQSNGFVQYGSTTIGSINCLPPQRPQAATPRKP